LKKQEIPNEQMPTKSLKEIEKRKEELVKIK